MRLRDLHETFGTYRYVELCSEEGIAEPAEQVAVIVWFVSDRLSAAESRLPRQGEEGIEWLAELFRSALREIDPQSALEYVSRNRGAYDVWGLRRDCAELLNYRCGSSAYSLALRRLHSRGYTVDLPLVENLAVEFVAVRLPRAVGSFDPVRGKGSEAAWLASTFFRFALRSVTADLACKAQFETLENVLASGPATAKDREKDQEMADALKLLPLRMSELPYLERRAISLYFGLEEPEQTLSQVGSRLQVSPHLARIAILKGIGILAAGLGIGPFDRRQFTYLNLALREGRELSSVALVLSCSIPEARELEREVFGKLCRGLRRRTVAPPPQQKESERTEMSAVENHERIVIQRKIASLLENLSHEPRCRLSSAGWEAELEGEWFSIAAIRDAVRSDPALASRLDAKEVPAGWMITPAGNRSGMLQEVIRWSHETEEIRNNSWRTAEVMWELCSESADGARAMAELGESAMELSHPSIDARAAAIDQIHRLMGSIAIGFESRLDPELRHARTAVLIVEKQDDQIVAFWEHDPELRFNLEEMIHNRTQQFLEWTPAISAIVTDIFLREILREGSTLPSFRPRPRRTDRAASFDFAPPQPLAEAREEFMESVMSL